MAFVAKPATRLEMLKAPMAKISRARRPKVSATLAKRRRKAPELRADEALIQVICALVMERERPMGAVMTVQMP